MGKKHKTVTEAEALSSGTPVYRLLRDIPDDWRTEGTWKLKGFVLKEGAKPRGYRIHGRYVSPLYDAADVEPKEIIHIGRRKGRVPGLRLHARGQYYTKYRQRNKYFGKDHEKAKVRYAEWLRDVWSRDQMGLPTSKEYADLWNIPNGLAWLANELREYAAWTYPSCIYFLLREHEVTYIGSTKTLPNRILQHINEGKQFDRVLWMPVKEKRMLQLEDQMIQRLQPGENIRSRGFREGKRG